jgi:hypothetical protein
MRSAPRVSMPSVSVAADRRQQRHRCAEARQVFRDIARDAAERFRLRGRVRRAEGQRVERTQLAVEVRCADADDRAAVRQHVGPSQQLALTDQAGDITGDGRARHAQLVGEVLLRDERVRPYQVEQLLLF